MSTISKNQPHLKWLGSPPSVSFGTTFGVPWPRGIYWPDKTSFVCTTDNGEIPLQSWITAYWPDGSIKWTGHTIATHSLTNNYSIRAIPSQETKNAGIKIEHDTSGNSITVDTGKILVAFPTTGDEIIKSITKSHGKCIGSRGHLILLSRTEPPELGECREYKSDIESVTIEQEGPIRAVLAVRGNHHLGHRAWLPFILRFYLYLNSEAIRVVHTIIYDGDPQKDFIQGIGIRFHVPLEDELPYNRHVRFTGVDGVFGEAVQGVTGLRRNPGIDIRKAQIDGQSLPPPDTWGEDVGSYMGWVPCWNDYTLSQLSPDGYTMKKRTDTEHSWVNIPGGTRSGGLAYLGGASRGGLGIGMRHFWERYPTSLDVRGANGDAGEITLWLHSPSAEVMDLRPYHDGLQQDSYDEQLDALRITYEDWEEDTGTPYGIARTNEVYIFAFDKTPSSAELVSTIDYMRNPPVLIPGRQYIADTRALGEYWSPLKPNPSSKGKNINNNLNFLFTFYQTQIHQRRWYGFWDHGDIMHTYDEDRHTWRYDVGGYAWDNSELSPDLFFWLYFLRTGREDVYRLAESLTRHTSEVDTYHIGPWKGLGTRHGVQHWSDSCKQARVSSAIYRRIFYYLTGGDERIGDVLDETLDAEGTLLTLDPYRKVRTDRDSYRPAVDAVSISLGTDWSAFAAAWFIAWERRVPGWEDLLSKLVLSMRGIGRLYNGFVTGMALYNTSTGDIYPPSHDADNKGTVKVSHLSAMFGLLEICAELIDNLADDTPDGFKEAWLDYCRYFNADAEDQRKRYGVDFGSLILRQGHSRLTAYAAKILNDPNLGDRAWKEFYTGDGYGDVSWESQAITGSHVPVAVDEASWISTNISALYGLAAIQNLALLGIKQDV